METAAIYVILIFAVVCGFGIYKGLDLRKGSSWLYGLFAILIGLLLGFLRDDINSGFKIGIFIGLTVIFSGAVVRWQKQLFTNLGGWNRRRTKK